MEVVVVDTKMEEVNSGDLEGVPGHKEAVVVKLGVELLFQVDGVELQATTLDTKPEVQLTGEALQEEDMVLVVIQVIILFTKPSDAYLLNLLL